MREQTKIDSDVEVHSRIKTDSVLTKVRHVMHVIRQDILRQFVELRTKETNLNQNRLRNLKLLPVVIAIQILIHNRELKITFSV